MLLPLIATLAIESSRLQVGTTWSGEQVLRYHSKESEIDETHRFKLSFKVTGMEQKMWVVERSSLLTGSRIDDTELPPPPQKDPLVMTEWLSPAGFLLDLDPYERGLFHLDRLIHFWLPSHQP